MMRCVVLLRGRTCWLTATGTSAPWRTCRASRGWGRRRNNVGKGGNLLLSIYKVVSLFIPMMSSFQIILALLPCTSLVGMCTLPQEVCNVAIACLTRVRFYSKFIIVRPEGELTGFASPFYTDNDAFWIIELTWIWERLIICNLQISLSQFKDSRWC